MGTSNSYGGPGGNKPLLPPWANDPLPDFPPPSTASPEDAHTQPTPENQPSKPSPLKPIDQIPQKPNINPIRISPELGQARAHVTRFVGGGKTSFISRGVRSYTRSLGGAKGGTRAARTGRVSTQRLGGFLSGVATKGISRAADDLGVENIVGKPLATALSLIVDKISPDSSTLEEAVARRAICKTLEELYKRYELDAKGIEGLNNITLEAVNEAVILSAVNYVFEKLLLDLMASVEKRDISEENIVKLEKEMRSYVRVKVEQHFKDKKSTSDGGINWLDTEGMRAVNQIYFQAYQILEESQ